MGIERTKEICGPQASSRSCSNCRNRNRDPKVRRSCGVSDASCDSEALWSWEPDKKED